MHDWRPWTGMTGWVRLLSSLLAVKNRTLP